MHRSADECMKGSAFMVEHMLDITAASSQDPSICPLTRAFNTNLNCFQWIEKPENVKRMRRGKMAMTSSDTSMTPEDLLLSVYCFSFILFGPNMTLHRRF
jgi:hypothetical protein